MSSSSLQIPSRPAWPARRALWPSARALRARPEILGLVAGATGVFRLLQSGLGDQAGWLLGFALVFSFASGIFHPYYVSFLAPWTAMLVGAGIGEIHVAPRAGRARALAPLMIAGGVVTELVVLGHLRGYLSWALPVVLAAAIVSEDAEVAGLGGFSGREGSVTAAWLATEVRDGRLRWILPNGTGSFGGPGVSRRGSAAAFADVAKACRAVTVTGSTLFDCQGRAPAILAAGQLR